MYILISILKYFINYFLYLNYIYFYFIPNISIKKYNKYDTIHYKYVNKMYLINIIKESPPPIDYYQLINKNINDRKYIMYACVIHNTTVTDITEKLNSFIHYNYNKNIFWYHFLSTINVDMNNSHLIIYINNETQELNIDDIYYKPFEIYFIF